MGVEQLETQIAQYQARVDKNLDSGQDDVAEKMNREVQRMERKLAKEEAKLPVHPA